MFFFEGVFTTPVLGNKDSLILDGDWKLVVVTQASSVGQVPHGGAVYCVDKVGIIPLTSNSGTAAEIFGLEVCSYCILYRAGEVCLGLTVYGLEIGR